MVFMFNFGIISLVLWFIKLPKTTVKRLFSKRSSTDSAELSSSSVDKGGKLKCRNSKLSVLDKEQDKQMEKKKDNRMMLTVLLSSIPGVERAKGATYTWFIRVKFAVFQVVSAAVILITLLWASVFLYGCFHYWYMPTISSYERPLYFKFATRCDSVDGLCGFPHANISLVSKNQKEILVTGQPYVVTVDLEMPESYVNQQLGMFMIQAEFYTDQGEVHFTASKSVMMHFKSYLYRIIETFWILPSLLYGTTSEKQIVSVELTQTYIVDSLRPTRGVYIEVQNRRVEIYSAWIRIHARFSGLRYLLYYWPRVSAFFGVASNFFFLSVISIFSWLLFSTNSSSSSSTEDTQVDKKLCEKTETNNLNKNYKSMDDDYVNKGSGRKQIGDLYDEVDEESCVFEDAVENLASAGRYYQKSGAMAAYRNSRPFTNHHSQNGKEINTTPSPPPGLRRRITGRILRSLNLSS